MISAMQKHQISEAFQRVRNFSFEEKKQAVYDESQINLFLDAILDFKKMISDKTARIEEIIEKSEKITWLNDPEKDSLMLINDLVAALKDVHSSLMRQYTSLNLIRSKNIIIEEIKSFKSAIDDLRDVYSDLESRFFYLPKIEAFEETTKELALV
jgi:hypothetical protein